MLARKYNLEEEVDFNQVVHQCLHSDANQIMSFMQQPEKIVDYFNLRREQTREVPFIDRLLALKARPQKHFTVTKSIMFFKSWCKKNNINWSEFVLSIQMLVNKQITIVTLGGSHDIEGKIYVLNSLCQVFSGDVNYIPTNEGEFSLAILDQVLDICKVFCPTIFVLSSDYEQMPNLYIATSDTELMYYSLKRLNPLMWLTLFQEIADNSLHMYLK